MLMTQSNLDEKRLNFDILNASYIDYFNKSAIEIYIV